MSLDTWEEEFYPVAAKEFKNASDEECVEHALQKWRGALPENCEKHETSYEDHEIFEPDSEYLMFAFTGNTCSLCQKYPDTCKDDDENYCPIVRFLGESCDCSVDYDTSEIDPAENARDEFREAYYEAQNDPTIMIELLTHTLNFVKRENQYGKII